ncbi:DUF3768 domain-containing protein [Sphingobium tyrosinilyticum]|uniref:DUF3768 domain-containing protein n=1 Tax=Sphingobium tyrosinilyticum TaxID=2715436 RepID=A0ABV9EYZ1_9SPHN
MSIELTAEQKVERIRTLNDLARKNPGVAGRAVMTAGFAAREDLDHHAAITLIMAFNQFDEGNDPHGEHDFGAIYRLPSGEWVPRRPEDKKPIAETIFWKIDCYDNALEFGSEAPWDAERTTRVLTIMLASEY